ncbi:MAG: hypothetical protein ABSE49_05545 [Polyangiaceae bacterium]
MKSLARATGVALPVLLLLATACTSVLGVQPLPSATCDGDTPTDDCGSCINAECCAEEMACVDDSACQSIVDCADGCPTGDGFSACLDSCGTSNPAGIDDYNSLADCSTSACTTACSGSGS